MSDEYKCCDDEPPGDYTPRAQGSLEVTGIYARDYVTYKRVEGGSTEDALRAGALRILIIGN